MDHSSLRASVYDGVTRDIIKRIERGTKPWMSPWVGGDDHPRNALTKKHYTGLNALILWSAAFNLGFPSNFWLTARQAKLMGGYAQADARGTTIFVGRRVFTRAGDRAAMRRNGVNPGYGFQRQYLLFNVSQVCGLPPEPTRPPPTPDHIYPRLQSLIAATGAEIRVGGKRAYFDPIADYVQLPPRGLFFDPNDRGDYGRTTLHELSHWAAGPRRLNTVLPGETRYDRYAAGELLAELSSAYCCLILGIVPTAEPADYVAEWLRILKAEPDLLWETAPEAARVSDHILSFDPQP